MSIAENIAHVKERIRMAARRAGRNPDEITLMAVTKTFPADLIREAYAGGIRVFGENRVQEFATKADAVRDLAEAEWHMIGHLQSNKAGKAAELFDAVDSVDSFRLAQRLDIPATQLRKTVKVLLEVNIGGEQAKSGLEPGSPELEQILRAGFQLTGLKICGLMTVPPYSEDPEHARSCFRRLRELRERLAAQNFPSITLETLSMGMSHDFEIAIEEGCTCVRVGTAIFGKRQKL
jgi:PLP dependent protein